MEFTDTKGLNAYQPPFTVHTKVETEGGICADSVIQKDSKSIKATGHELGNEYDFTNQELTWE